MSLTDGLPLIRSLIPTEGLMFRWVPPSPRPQNNFISTDRLEEGGGFGQRNEVAVGGALLASAAVTSPVI